MEHKHDKEYKEIRCSNLDNSSQEIAKLNFEKLKKEDVESIIFG